MEGIGDVVPAEFVSPKWVEFGGEETRGDVGRSGVLLGADDGTTTPVLLSQLVTRRLKSGDFLSCLMCGLGGGGGLFARAIRPGFLGGRFGFVFLPARDDIGGGGGEVEIDLCLDGFCHSARSSRRFSALLAVRGLLTARELLLL